jgi:hypothetical protein
MEQAKYLYAAGNPCSHMFALSLQNLLFLNHALCGKRLHLIFETTVARNPSTDPAPGLYLNI